MSKKTVAYLVTFPKPVERRGSSWRGTAKRLEDLLAGTFGRPVVVAQVVSRIWERPDDKASDQLISTRGGS